jgi:HD-like signal output (HDOD) protein/CheY-like chemotaxis protein
MAGAETRELRALVVEDEAFLRVLTARALTRAGLSCRTAGDGREAAELLRSDRFDLVVTDLKMPNRNGHSLAVDLLGRPDRPAVVVLTGVLEPKISHDLIERGVERVFLKPVDYRAFADEVLSILRSRTAEPADRQTEPVGRDEIPGPIGVPFSGSPCESASDSPPTSENEADSENEGNEAEAAVAPCDEIPGRCRPAAPPPSSSAVTPTDASEATSAESNSDAPARAVGVSIDFLRKPGWVAGLVAAASAAGLAAFFAFADQGSGHVVAAAVMLLPLFAGAVGLAVATVRRPAAGGADLVETPAAPPRTSSAADAGPRADAAEPHVPPLAPAAADALPVPSPPDGHVDSAERGGSLRESAAGPPSATADAVVAIRMADPARAGGLADRLAQEGYTAIVADTTDGLHALLNRDRVDVLVLEDRLPGFLSGLDVLEMFARELLRPDAVLLADPRREDALRVRELRSARVLPSAADTEAVVAAVRDSIARRSSGGAPVPAAARLIVAGHAGLRPMPQLLVKLTGYLSVDETEVPIADFARDVAADPQAAAELLRVSNSAAFGLRRVTKVADAVSLLGARRAASLLLSGAAIGTAAELIESWSEPLRAWYYRRTALTAGAAQAFAKLEGVSPDTAFLLGLMQDLGVAAMAESGGERYAKTVARATSVPQLRLDRVERVELGYTHADVSAALLQKWELPASLVGPVLAHHGEDEPLSKTERAFVRAMRVGESLADLADCPSPQRRMTLNRLLSAYEPPARPVCRDALAEAIARAVEASSLFSLPAPDSEALRRLDAELEAARTDAADAG